MLFDVEVILRDGGPLHYTGVDKLEFGDESVSFITEGFITPDEPRPIRHEYKYEDIYLVVMRTGTWNIAMPITEV